jgi:hypothetical protein
MGSFGGLQGMFLQFIAKTYDFALKRNKPLEN